MFYKYLFGLFSVICMCILFMLFQNDSLNSKNVEFLYDKLSSFQNEESKIFVSYVHHIDTNSEATKENFKFFMFFGVQPCDSRIDYRIVLNMNNLNEDLNNKLAKALADDELMNQIESCTNVVIVKNQNTRDLCAHSQQLKREAWNSEKHKYKYFFFLNSTPRGPFLPNYWKEPWWKIFTNKFSLNPKLVATGPYLSTEYHPHIQSFFVVVDHRGLKILDAIWRCQVEDNDMHWIINTELVIFIALHISQKFKN